ncbi:MAG TPA: TetR family transcriptional regulator [Polyangiaceae bacterium]|nr:TetR family transcriptional regulator [Polyangiaceae bacterium]
MTVELEAAPGLRERKKAEAKRALVEAALELFGERGFDAVTVDEIAARANVSRRTFFRYFPTKEAVVMDRRRAQLEALGAHLGAAPTSAPLPDAIRGALLVVARDYEANKRRILAERQLFARSPSLALADLDLDRAFEGQIARWVAPRIGRGEAARKRARMFAAALIAVLRVAIEDWADARGKVSLEELGEEAVDAVMGLIGTKGGSR